MSDSSLSGSPVSGSPGDGLTGAEAGPAPSGTAPASSPPADSAPQPDSATSAPAAQPQSTWGQAALNGEATPDTGIPAGAGSPIGSGAAGGGGGHSARSTPRGPKPIRGPRFSGSPLIAGLGLLGLLVTIAIMALLAVRVLDGMNSTAKAVNSPTVPGVGGALIPAEPVPGGAGASGGNATDAARAATCSASKAVIETAVESYSTIEGSVPSSIDDLVSTGFLQTNDGSFKLEPASDGSVRVVGIGDCETAN